MQWYTPRHIIDAIGPFDLDPCASPDPRPWPIAQTHLTEADDGLAHKWFGMVFMNPPYGREIGVWMERMAEHNHGVALVFARTDTSWFQRAAPRSSPLLFLAGRVQFVTPKGVANGRSPAPSVLMAYGSEAAQRLRHSGIAGWFA